MEEKTGIDVLSWVSEAEKLGVGEILLTSVDQEGTQSEYDLQLVEEVCHKVNVPVVIAGSVESITNLLDKNIRPSICIASLFHYKKYTPKSIKKLLNEKGFNVRIGRANMIAIIDYGRGNLSLISAKVLGSRV